MKNLIAISAPSGAGKTSLCRELQRRVPEFRFSVSYTTRPRRLTEREGVDYNFISHAEFLEKIEAGELAEYEEVHGYLYGTRKQDLEAAISENRLLLLEVDVYGALHIRSLYPEHTLTIFILPPDLNLLKKRLRSRGTDSEARIIKRLERIDREMSVRDQFDYLVINDDLTRAADELLQIINNQEQGVSRGS